MAQLRDDPAAPSPAASRLLHPAAGAQQLIAPADVLPDIAAGLARTVPVAAAGVTEGGTALLLTTAAYQASLEAIEADSCRVIESPPDLPASLALVSGQLLVWTAEEGSQVLSPGGLCSIGGGERVQLVNIGPDRAVAVLVRTSRAADSNGAGTDPSDPEMARFAPCAPATR